MIDAQFERLLDVREAAQVLRLHPDTVKKMAWQVLAISAQRVGLLD